MSELTEHFKVCDCHDSWDQCPCAEAGHPLDRDCGCCPLGVGLCGPLPTAAQRRDALLAKFEALADDLAAAADERDGERDQEQAVYVYRKASGMVSAVIKEARA